MPLSLDREAMQAGPAAASPAPALWALAASGDYVVVSGTVVRLFDIGLMGVDAPGIRVFDVHDPLTTTLRGTLGPEFQRHGLAAIEGSILVFNGTLVRQLNLADPDAPTWGAMIDLAQLPGPGNARFVGGVRKLLSYGRHFLVLTNGQVGAVTKDRDQSRASSLVTGPSELLDMAIESDYSRMHVAAGNDGLWILGAR